MVDTHTFSMLSHVKLYVSPSRTLFTLNMYFVFNRSNVLTLISGKSSILVVCRLWCGFVFS